MHAIAGQDVRLGLANYQEASFMRLLIIKRCTLQNQVYSEVCVTAKAHTVQDNLENFRQAVTNKVIDFLCKHG